MYKNSVPVENHCVSTCPLLGTDKDPDFSVLKDIIKVIFWNGDKAV